MNGIEGKQREQWGSRVGFILAAAGSAVGLGNIWRFPYLTGENGGSAFILIYLGFVVVVCLSVMIAEFAVGRRTKLSAVGAYKKFSPSWTFAGVLGVLSAFLIMGFYPVVGGWSLAYIYKSVAGLLSSAGISDAFGAFIGDPIQPVIWMIVYLAINVVIVAKGIAGGIEKAGKVLMPTLFVLLLIIIGRSVTLPGSSAGMDFLLKPDFSKVTGQTFLAALGQAFFSLSLGMGCMMTYGSYLNKNENIPKNALIVTMMDTTCAILAGLAIFPALFAFGLEPTEGPGLVFVVVPTLFSKMGGIGVILSVIFFVALTVAALTSSVSLLEVVVAYLIDEKGVSRKASVGISGGIMVITSMLASLSMGLLSDFTIFGVGFFDLFDKLTDKIFLAIGGALLAVFVGWFVKKEDLHDELTNGGTHEFKLFNVWYILMKFVIPIAIVVVATMGMISMVEDGLLPLMLFGIGIIGVAAIFSKKL
ncbi:MAG TPA: sodium-dependent transporter [Syntrophomonadaceae bacterium]|nr:sodium-dependent transporter [Syntrophomonadaceae bacterium]